MPPRWKKCFSPSTPRDGAETVARARRGAAADRRSGGRFGEYSPLEVKMSVVGYGRAEKSQVQQMVRRCCGGWREPIESEDASDALAIAICHATRAEMRFLAAVLISGMALWAQNGAPVGPPAKHADSANPTEDQQLTQAIGEAGTSQVDFIRALEKHLAKFPDTSRRNEIERAIVLAAIKTKDDKRIVEYGERVLAREPDDISVLDKVVRALLIGDARDTSEQALRYATHYEELLRQTRLQTLARPHERHPVA
jgi:hypothetical protein